MKWRDWIRRIALAVGFAGGAGCDSCSSDEPANVDRSAVQELTSCEQALSHLQAWSGADSLDSQRTASMVVACEDSRSMATVDRLDCLLEEGPDEAAHCMVLQERQGVIEACVSDAGEDFRSHCEESLSIPAPALLEARARPLRDGRWLELWQCHAPEDGELAPSPDSLLACGLDVTRRIRLKECGLSGVNADECGARWLLQRPVMERRLRDRLPPGTDE